MLSSPPPRLFFLLLAGFGAPALAAPGDTLRFYGGMGGGHDAKRLRVPEGSPGADKQLDDTGRAADAGLVVDHSGQRVGAQLKLSKAKFNHFFRQRGDHLEGALSASDNQSQAPYTQLAGDQRKLRRERRRNVEPAASAALVQLVRDEGMA